MSLFSNRKKGHKIVFNIEVKYSIFLVTGRGANLIKECS
jgi:hypothetical protein